MSEAKKLPIAKQITVAVNRILAADSASRLVIQACASASGLDALSSKSLKKALLSTARNFRENGRLGRLEAIILLALVTLGDNFLKQVERAKLLLCDIGTIQKTSKFLAEFDRKLGAVGDEWHALRARLATYAAYAGLLEATADRVKWLVGEAKSPMRMWAPRLIALAELRFLNAYFHLSVSEQHAAWFRYFETPEDFAEAVSAILAISNASRELDAIDFSFPATDHLTDPHLLELLRAGCAVKHVEMWKIVSAYSNIP